MATRGQAPVGWRHHRFPKGLCLGEFKKILDWNKANDNSGSHKWRLKAQLLCFKLPHIFGLPTRPSFVFTGPKTQDVPGISPLYVSVKQISYLVYHDLIIKFFHQYLSTLQVIMIPYFFNILSLFSNWSCLWLYGQHWFRAFLCCFGEMCVK